jgi:hypothetical protein
MLQFILRGLAFGFLIVSVAEIARRFPRLGALILTLPIVIPIVFLAMYLRDGDLAPIAKLSRRTLILIPLGLPFFIPLAFAERLRLPFWAAFAAGLAIVAVLVTLYLWLDPREV